VILNSIRCSQDCEDGINTPITIHGRQKCHRSTRRKRSNAVKTTIDLQAAVLTFLNNLTSQSTTRQNRVATAITFESDKPRPQRALQGGGALGAYEAGAFRALYEFLSKEDEEKQLFDIVAGTSIGAINAAILVSHVIENGTWKGSVNSLLEFWDDISRGVWDVSDLNIWWNNW